MKTKYILLLLFFFFSGLNSQLSAQDVHFSQIFATPLFYSPAATGDYEGEWRVMNTYRTQWRQVATPFVSNALAVDKQFSHFANTFSAGLMYINDNSGDVRIKSNKVYLSGGYHSIFNRKSTWHVGLQLGFVRKALEDGYSFPNQFNNDIGEFDATLPSEEDNLNTSLSYLDVNVGGFWRGKLGPITPTIGGAIFHLNNPKESFQGENEKLPLRYMANVGIRWNITSLLDLTPYLLASYHAKASEVLGGADLRIHFRPNNAGLQYLFGGAFYRSGVDRITDALVYKFGLKVQNLRIGVSYDSNISELQTASNQEGAYELSLIYIKPSLKPSKPQVPCDRF